MAEEEEGLTALRRGRQHPAAGPSHRPIATVSSPAANGHQNLDAATTIISKITNPAVSASNWKSTPRSTARMSNVTQFQRFIQLSNALTRLICDLGRDSGRIVQMVPTSPTPCSSPAVVCPCGCGDEDVEHQDNYVVRKAQTQMVRLIYYWTWHCNRIRYWISDHFHWFDANCYHLNGT